MFSTFEGLIELLCACTKQLVSSVIWLGGIFQNNFCNKTFKELNIKNYYFHKTKMFDRYTILHHLF